MAQDQTKEYKPFTLIDDSRGIGMVSIIIVVLIVFAGAGYYILSNKSKVQIANPSQNTSSNGSNVSNLNFKDPNEFFPTSINGNQIRGAGIESYKIAQVPVTEFTSEDTPENVHSRDQVAKIDLEYRGFYGPEGGKTDNIVKEKSIRVTYTKFATSQSTSIARTINEKAYLSTSQGFQKVSLPLNNLTYWALYREVPSGKAGDNFAGSARILFPDALTMVEINVWGGYTLDQFGVIVKNYADSLIANNTQFITKDEMLTTLKYQEIKNKQTSDQVNQQFNQEKQKAQQDFENKVKNLQQNGASGN